jgi:uncharacterized protein with FMN-binding domain
VRTRAIISSTLASLGVLVIGWQAGAAAITASETTTTSTTASSATGSTTGSTSGSTATTESSTTDTSTTAPTETTPATSTVADGTYTGAAASTRWGDVQVSVTISGGAITDVTALKLTDADGKSVQISNRAAPILREEVIAAQSANVSNVSGATYTTQAYLASVQSALDQAGF